MFLGAAGAVVKISIRPLSQSPAHLTDLNICRLQESHLLQVDLNPPSLWGKSAQQVFCPAEQDVVKE
jgi:hypothetical protein